MLVDRGLPDAELLDEEHVRARSPGDPLARGVEIAAEPVGTGAPEEPGRAPRRGPELVGSRAADEAVPAVVALEEVVPVAAGDPVVAGRGTVAAVGEEVVVAAPSVDDVAAALAVEPVRPERAEEGVRVLASRRSGAGSGSARSCRPRRRSPSPTAGPVPRSTRTGPAAW